MMSEVVGTNDVGGIVTGATCSLVIFTRHVGNS
jgi:hypothetical protein